MDTTEIVSWCLIIGFFVAVISSVASVFKIGGLSAKVDAYIEALASVRKEVVETSESWRRFEADSYSVKKLDDGRVEVSFLQTLGEDDKGTETYKVRRIIMPVDLWSQVTAETALKMAFEAAKLKKED